MSPRKDRSPVTQQLLKSILHYDPDTGVFTRIVRRGHFAPGHKAGTTEQRAQSKAIGINGRYYGAHRLAWLYVHGEWPPHHIDHIDGNPLNNKLANLRLATYSQNNANSRRRRNNTTGFKGVSRKGSRFVAAIQANGKSRHIGMFATPEEAHAAYLDAARKYHGQFARAE